MLQDPKLIAALIFCFPVFYLLIASIYITRTDKEPVFRLCVIFWAVSMFLSYISLGYLRIAHLIHIASPKYWTSCAVIGDSFTRNRFLFSFNFNLCLFAGMHTNFIFLSGFMWMTIISFDLWSSVT